jgi:acyl dehydratase
MTIYFEDIVIGSKAAFGRYDVTREEVLAFAGKYDPQLFHLSDEEAAKTHFGRISASGWHSCSMVMAMVVENLKKTAQAGLGSPGVDELRWLKPVYPGDTLRCETEVFEKRRSQKRPEMGSFRSRMMVYNQDNIAVMSFISIGLIRVREQTAEK